MEISLKKKIDRKSNWLYVRQGMHIVQRRPTPHIDTQYVNIIVTFIFSGTPPTIVQPPNGGYWVDGVEENSSDEESESRPQPGTPRQNSRRHNIDTDDTAKYYRRFFLGKVR